MAEDDGEPVVRQWAIQFCIGEQTCLFDGEWEVKITDRVMLINHDQFWCISGAVLTTVCIRCTSAALKTVGISERSPTRFASSWCYV
ncbi:hypothetical protein Mal65_29250 [Crateriforma conspicua]|nr:hypothetical protein Mal65_29250 [Crateriforma conspicua]